MILNNSQSTLLDHASTPKISDPTPDARSCQKITVLSGDRTTSQYVLSSFRLSAKKLTEQNIEEQKQEMNL